MKARTLPAFCGLALALVIAAPAAADPVEISISCGALGVELKLCTEGVRAWEKKTGVRVGAGDAMLLRWGRWARGAAIGPWNTDEGAAGLDNTVIPWLKKRDIALLSWETPGYVPQPPGDLPRLALHNFVLSHLGVMLIDRGDFDALATAAAARNRWEFMLTVGPLPIPNGTGSPVNPIAIF